MKPIAATLSLLIALTASAAPPPPEPREDPFAQSLFPPELVMEHQQELGLQESQRTAIQEETLKAQSVFLDRQWKLAAEGEKLKKLLDATPIDEARALEQVDRVLSAEREIKRAQLGLLIRIRNVLNERQREKLLEIRQHLGPPPR